MKVYIVDDAPFSTRRAMERLLSQPEKVNWWEQMLSFLAALAPRQRQRTGWFTGARAK